MAWEIEFTDEFEEWWHTLSESEQGRVDARVELLMERGPSLGFPFSSQVKTSRFPEMRELRVQAGGDPLRMLYAFDPRRVAILLIAGDKTGDDRWYETNVPVADRLFERHLKTIEKETNPGMFRSMATSWLPEINGFAHPPATMVEELVEAALHMANHADAPACARAAWLTFTMLAIHPFVDGNGRTSRALYMAVLAPSLPLGIDWAALEQWSVWRDDYIYALQAGQDMEHYDPTKMTAAPFITFATRASIAGADLCKDRLEFIATYVEARVRDGLPRPHAIVLTTVSMWGIATLAELAECVLPAADIDEIVGQLLTGGKLRWIPRPHSRRTFDRPEPFGLIAV